VAERWDLDDLPQTAMPLAGPHMCHANAVAQEVWPGDAPARSAQARHPEGVGSEAPACLGCGGLHPGAHPPLVAASLHQAAAHAAPTHSGPERICPVPAPGSCRSCSHGAEHRRMAAVATAPRPFSAGAAAAPGELGGSGAGAASAPRLGRAAGHPGGAAVGTGALLRSAAATRLVT
jgi:hypothetical protein